MRSAYASHRNDQGRSGFFVMRRRALGVRSHIRISFSFCFLWASARPRIPLPGPMGGRSSVSRSTSTNSLCQNAFFQTNVFYALALSPSIWLKILTTACPAAAYPSRAHRTAAPAPQGAGVDHGLPDMPAGALPPHLFVAPHRHHVRRQSTIQGWVPLSSQP